MKVVPPVKRSWTQVVANGDLICVNTYSGYRRSSMDDSQPEFILEPDVSNQMLGESLLSCLSASRFLSPDEIETFFALDVVQRRYVEWVARLNAKHGYQNKRALFKEMMRCLAKREGNTITISPTHHAKLEGWSGDGMDGKDVVVSAHNTLEEIGIALREAFTRCT